MEKITNRIHLAWITLGRTHTHTHTLFAHLRKGAHRLLGHRLHFVQIISDVPVIAYGLLLLLLLNLTVCSLARLNRVCGKCPRARSLYSGSEWRAAFISLFRCFGCCCVCVESRTFRYLHPLCYLLCFAVTYCLPITRTKNYRTRPASIIHFNVTNDVTNVRN